MANETILQQIEALLARLPAVVDAHHKADLQDERHAHARTIDEIYTQLADLYTQLGQADKAQDSTEKARNYRFEYDAEFLTQHLIARRQVMRQKLRTIHNQFIDAKPDAEDKSSLQAALVELVGILDELQAQTGQIHQPGSQEYLAETADLQRTRQNSLTRAAFLGLDTSIFQQAASKSSPSGPYDPTWVNSSFTSAGATNGQEHPKTGLHSIDTLVDRSAQQNRFIDPEAPKMACRGDFMVRAISPTEQDDQAGRKRFYISPVGGTADIQEIEVVVQDPEIADKLGKSAYQILPLKIVKTRNEDGEPILLVTAFAPWRDPEASVKTTIFKDGKWAPAKFSYSAKYTYGALQRYYRIRADLHAQKTRLQLLRLSTEQTAQLLEVSHTAASLRKHLEASNLSKQYDQAIAGIAAKKDKAWIAGKLGDTSTYSKAWIASRLEAWQKDHPLQPASAFSVDKEIIRDAIVAEALQGIAYHPGGTTHRSYKELLTAPLPKPLSITYKDETGQDRTEEISSIGHNLYFNDDRQFAGESPRHAAIWKAIQEDPEALLSYAAKRAVFRSISNHASLTSARVDKETGGPLSVLTEVPFRKDKDAYKAFTKASDDLVTATNKELVEKGILFRPNKDEDAIVPGYAGAVAYDHAIEWSQADISRVISRDQIRAFQIEAKEQEAQNNPTGPRGVIGTTAGLDDDFDKKSGFSINDDTAASNFQQEEANIEGRIERLQENLKKAEIDVLNGVNGDRIDAGMTPVGMQNSGDLAKALAVFEIGLAAFLSGIDDMMGFEKNIGLV